VARKKEEFRRALVKLIHRMNPPQQENKALEDLFRTMGDSFETDDGKIPKLDLNFDPTPDDLGELRYSFYIHHGLDAINIGDIMDEWLENIWKNVPEKLRLAYDELFAELNAEVRDGYRIAVKRAMVEFVLHEPDRHTVAQLDSGARGDDMLKRVPKPWRSSIIAAKKKLLRNLHAYNPVLSYIHLVWRSVFG
jgi:hypothetical protein